MNKKQLIKNIKKYVSRDVNFNMELFNKQVLFYLYGYDNREVCCLEIPYTDRLDKKAIYISILDLLKRFDFSFKVTFDNTKDIYTFLEVL